MKSFFVGVIGLFLVLLSGHVISASDPNPGLRFIENKNQWPSDVQFSADIPGGTMVVRAGGFSYYFVDNSAMHGSPPANPDASAPWSIRGHVVDVNFLRANASASPRPFGLRDDYYNYFIGKDRKKWASRARAYEGILYPDFYQDIDLKVYSSGDNLKYDFLVSPGGDPARISIRYDGAESLSVLKNGDLRMTTTMGEILEKKPIAWQYVNGRRLHVPCNYELRGTTLSFSFPEGYDRCYELVIDPLLIFSTYSGSQADNWGSTATPGENGTLYSGGITDHFVSGIFSGEFPATPGTFQTVYGGGYDVGILKYDSAGTQLLYASYLGGGGTDTPHSLIVNSKNELIIFGTTSSQDFPLENAFDATFNGGESVGQQDHVLDYTDGSDIFVSRISADGATLLSSTYIGGSLNDGLNDIEGGLVANYGDEQRGDIITDADDNVYVSSVTASSDFPIVNGFDPVYNGGATDAVVLKLTADLSAITWSTFLGGTGTDASHTIKVDNDNHVYVGGGTLSSDFPFVAGGFQVTKGDTTDGWIVKIHHSGSGILNSTFIGTDSFDQVYFIDLNEEGDVYVYGQTNSHSFPIHPSAVYRNEHSGQFIQKYDRLLSSRIFSTVFGSGRGVPDISPTAFLVNECNNLYMAGWGGATNTGFWNSNTHGMPVSPDAIQTATSGSDFYFLVLTDDASEFLYGTYLGGDQSRTHVDGGTSRFDKNGIVYHAVCSGCVSGNASGQPTSDFPVTAGAWSHENRSRNCNNAAFKLDLSSLKARIQTNSIRFDSPGLRMVCLPDKIAFENFSTGGELYEWDMGDGTLITRNNKEAIIHGYEGSGTYTVTLKAIDHGTCQVVDVTQISVIVNTSSSVVQDDDTMCFGDEYQLKAGGGSFYEWRSFSDGFFSSAANPTVTPQDTTMYFVTIHEANGCVSQDTVLLNVVPGINTAFNYELTGTCEERPILKVTSLTDSLKHDDMMFFDFGDGSTADLEEIEHLYQEDGLYRVRLVAQRNGCVFEAEEAIPVYRLVIPNIITPGGSAGLNDVLTVRLGEGELRTPANYGLPVSVIIYNRWGTVLFEEQNYQYDWSGEGLAAGIYFYDIAVQTYSPCKSWLQIVK